MHGETAHHSARFRRKPGCGLGFMMYTFIRMFFILIYVVEESFINS